MTTSLAEQEGGLDPLVAYFREVRRQHRIFTPAEELAAAQEIDDLERAFWLSIARRQDVCALLVHTLPDVDGPAGLSREDLADWLRLNDQDKAWEGIVVKALPERSNRSPFLYRQLVEARQRFVNANLLLAVSVAKRYLDKMPFLDLIQEANQGLMKAVTRFDWRRGFRFTTYATWWIKHAIHRGIADKGREVRLPVHLLELQQDVANASGRLRKRLQRRPSQEEIAQESGIPLRKLERLALYLKTWTIPLDWAPEEGGEGRALSEVLADPEAEDPADVLAEAGRAALIREVMGQVLSPSEREILALRFGFGGAEEQTLKAIGERYSLSRERIRQLQDKALVKLRGALKKRLRGEELL